MSLLPELLKSAARHGGTFVGGLLAARGLSTGEDTELALAALATFLGWAFSIWRVYSARS